MNPDEFEEELSLEKSRLFWRSVKDFFIGFLVSAALFGLFYGLSSIPADEKPEVP